MKTTAISASDVTQARRRAERLSGRLRLALRSRSWRGASGNWSGAGTGSSIDFQDHRNYLPGDDPRSIDWHAYARTGSYIMKLYREEVSPSVDLIIDLSQSMRLGSPKRQCSIELIYFSVQSALKAGCTLRAWLCEPTRPRALTLESLANPTRAAELLDAAPPESSLDSLASVPLRQGSLRIVISDCLYPGSPEILLRRLAAGKGQALILAPFAAQEADPEWHGAIELQDCESGDSRTEQLDADALVRYRLAYAAHFGMWLEDSRRFGVVLTRLPVEVELAEALRSHALKTGVVEPWD